MNSSRRTARPGRPVATAQKKKNAAGFIKRQAKKEKGPQLTDVYEFQQQKERRSRTSVDTRLGREEAAELGYDNADDDDIDESGGDMKQRARLIGENQENEGIPSDDDEEIDSDAAFEEGDEDRYAGFNFPSSKKSANTTPSRSQDTSKSKASVRFMDVDLDETVSQEENDEDGMELDEQAEDDDSEEGMVDLIDILDGKAKPYFASDSEDDEGGHSKSSESKQDGITSAPNAPSEDESDSDEEENGPTSIAHNNHPGMLELSISDADEASDAEGALDHLSSFITSLDSKGKRKADEHTEPAITERPRKRRVKEITEGVPENEFAARMGTGSQKLNLDDLLAPLATGSSTELSALKKTAKILSSSKAGTLSAPLPTRAQERIDREAAYEQTKEEVDKWSATMKRIREADHLSFPLQQPKEVQPSNLELNAKFRPTTELETSVDRLLKTARLREEDIAATEELKMNHLTPEEVQARRAELRQMRELMFRAEAKAKRVSKIKSKTYRRIRKKERAKLAEKLGDAEGDDLDEEEAQLKREVERARERATLRHKHTGKWAKSLRGRGELAEDQQRDINDMLDRGEKLRRRIQGIGSDEDDAGSDSDTNSEADVEDLKASGFNELHALRTQAESEPSEGAAKKGVFNMKFMKDSMAAGMQNVNDSIDHLINDLEGNGIAAGSEAPYDAYRGHGRVSFHPSQRTDQESLRSLGSLESNGSSTTLKSTDLLSVSPVDERSPHQEISVSFRNVPSPPPASDSVNPWLQAHGSSSMKVARKNEIVVGKSSAATDKSKHKLRKQASKREEAKQQAQNDAELEISLDNDLIPTAATSSKTAQNARDSAKNITAITGKAASLPNGDDAVSETEEQERLLQRKGKNPNAFQQRDLVAQAFANDNIVQEFADAKRREIKEDAPHEVDTTLPGWGSWGGMGTKKQAPKPHLIKRVAGVDPKSRADFGKANVIISEKRDKKAAKYLVKDLPYPYTSQAQFERSMDTPLGIEWNTRVGFQRGTLPRIVKKMGTVISPLEKLN